MAAVGMLVLVGLIVAVSHGDRHNPMSIEPVAIGHIHGIGIDPADGRLYIGAHLGVFAVSRDGDVKPVGRERFDTMGFTVAGPNRFLASGHPDLTSDRAPHLGLIESADAANNWTTLSLEGEADFHALEAAEDRTWGADSVGGRLLTSNNDRRWDLVADGEFIDVAVDPTDSERTLATDQSGRLRAYTASGIEQNMPDGPMLTYLDWPGRDELIGLASDGAVHRSRDQGATWEKVGVVPGQPSAFEAGAQAWYAASDSGLYLSSDRGRSWTPLFEFGDAS